MLCETCIRFNPLRTGSTVLRSPKSENKKIMKILDVIGSFCKSLDKLSCGPFVFIIFPLLGEFHHFL
jgi:hypothetical protein